MAEFLASSHSNVMIISYIQLDMSFNHAVSPKALVGASLKATIARYRGATVATRDVDDFEGSGVEVSNPWSVE